MLKFQIILKSVALLIVTVPFSMAGEVDCKEFADDFAEKIEIIKHDYPVGKGGIIYGDELDSFIIETLPPSVPVECIEEIVSRFDPKSEVGRIVDGWSFGFQARPFSYGFVIQDNGQYRSIFRAK